MPWPERARASIAGAARRARAWATRRRAPATREEWIRAAEIGHGQRLLELLERGADVEWRSEPGGWTAAMLAARYGYVGALRALMAAGCDIEAAADPHWRGARPLWLAAEDGQPECLRALLEAGAELDAADELGRTPAMMAASRGCESCLRMLMEAGVDLRRVDCDGRGAFDHAMGSISPGDGPAACVRLLGAVAAAQEAEEIGAGLGPASDGASKPRPRAL